MPGAALNNNNNNNNNKRHDKVSAQMHFNICKEIGVQLDKKTLVQTYTKLSSKTIKETR
jgi:hypothetical protein